MKYELDQKYFCEALDVHVDWNDIKTERKLKFMY